MPVTEMKRLSNLQMISVDTASSVSGSPGHLHATASGVPVIAKYANFSERVYDYASLFNDQLDKKFFKGRGLGKDSFQKLLQRVGACIDPADVSIVFYNFDLTLNNVISRDEFTTAVTLVQYEIDCRIEDIRDTLMSFNVGVSQNSGDQKPTSNKMRENRILAEIFRMVNKKEDGVLTLEEIIDMVNS